MISANFLASFQIMKDEQIESVIRRLEMTADNLNRHANSLRTLAKRMTQEYLRDGLLAMAEGLESEALAMRHHAKVARQEMPEQPLKSRGSGSLPS